jgi:choline dehydrogenase-like flavoprotein
MPNDWDIIVIGSGAGGGTFAYACARAGKRVLVLERGEKYSVAEPVHDEQAMLIDKRPYESRTIWVNRAPLRLYAGGVLGGGTSLYGAALLRPGQDDFHPGRHYGSRIPREIWDWPIRYEDLEPYYSEAENLYRVSGPNEDDFGPLGKPLQGYPRRPLALKPINRRIMTANRARGLKPFRLPLAIDFERCLQCPACPGYVCLNGSRQSAAHLLDSAARDGLQIEVRTGVEAERFDWSARGTVAAIRTRNLKSNEHEILRAKTYALAAGAIGSPLILLASGINKPLLGRNYMMHLSPVAFGIFADQTEGDATFVKQVGFADYYLGTKSYPHKLGLIQSLPVPGQRMISKVASKYLPPRLSTRLRTHLALIAGIVEDLPNPANRVSIGSGGNIELRHKFGAYDVERGQKLGMQMRRILRNAGALFSGTKRLPSQEHVAHQCGTVRFGKEPKSAIVDSDCRMFGSPNLFVVDGSVFPTSLGVGPALTIMANALRVARVAVQVA